MGNTETRRRINGTAKAMRRAASDLRDSPNAQELAAILRDTKQELDADDREALALLISGHLNRARGDRGAGAKNKAIHAAERDARQHAKGNRVALDKAAVTVARKHRVNAETLITKLRRSK